MPKSPKFQIKNTQRGWLLHVPASISDTGKLQRRYFKTRDAALAEATVLRNGYKAHGEKSSVLPPRVADQALAAWEILKDTGASLLDAARAYKAQWNSQRKSETFGAAVKTYLESRQNLRDSTLTSYKYSLEFVAKALHSSKLSDITVDHLAEILKDKGSTSSRMHRANLRAFWRWAAKSPRGWCDEKVIEALETERASNDADIKILKPDEVAALLHAAEDECSAAAVAYAIAVFGGVRMAELEKLKWADVHEEHIEIGRHVAKKHSRRLIPICESLRCWLDAYRNKVEDDDTIVPPNWRDVSKSVRRRAGWSVVARLLKNPPPVTRGAWPANACRHTCASVQVAIGTPMEDLIFKFGHSGGHDMLRSHYVSRLTAKDAKKILSIKPNNIQKNIVHLRSKA